jgi:hypothetical protein
MIEVILVGSTILNVLAGIALMTMVKIIREERKHYQDFTVKKKTDNNHQTPPLRWGLLPPKETT